MLSFLILQVDDSNVIGFLLPTEIIPLYLSTITMEIGCELTIIV